MVNSEKSSSLLLLHLLSLLITKCTSQEVNSLGLSNAYQFLCLQESFSEVSRVLLSKNVEKLVQCDPRLNLLSQQPDIILESPYFEAIIHGFDIVDSKGLTFSGFGDSGSPLATSSTSIKSAEHVTYLFGLSILYTYL